MAAAKPRSKLALLAPLGLAVVIVAAATVGIRLLFANDEAASERAVIEAEREAFIKKHYPLEVSVPKESIRTPPPIASSP